ncbi:MAG: hypothetical protein A2233_01445 [Candidatus Kerfeldbacteria bacterium RIFOXYA2_FULL_38_24]|uniref:Uncharacterized protein n=1 Tax=Candidatus Kerfeldbacteria bacterium RIFOXYB2_FULL_38_14 TaxID=1798547 RepID=A0A1G2BFS6_9BACT|nr:MAG: hypothetical protein A2233_01445 [Candidatus Kerfeldbacteria bacterium RIFOXYA2_FULL_38_24]OGY87399.1 MAG: hypothetical protein A2319_05535 [Candidatus Kerfeldbacteria bacterium RIFOXYB2_FULL_38_14]OGY90349.1 MAG: hypothetical protein A2458_04440 [Candidatus Kerfeldbacteria bacterium RIFOXYC2_FULL_38_9]
MRYLLENKKLWRHLLSAPIIYSGIIPVIIADLWIEIYHRLCFPLYGIPYVRRKSYVRIDRHKLSYLTRLQKINCMYCGYVNGVVQYWVKIAGETEKYWCGIAHKKTVDFFPPPHHQDFLEYDNKEAFNRQYKRK